MVADIALLLVGMLAGVTLALIAAYWLITRT